MKYKLNKYVLGIFTLIFLLTSCEKEDQLASIDSKEIEKGYVVKDGYLAFKNNESNYIILNKQTPLREVP